MVKGLERIVGELQLNQTKGIFIVAKQVEEDTGIKRWRNKLIKTLEQAPLIVQEERYSRRDIARHLSSCFSTINKLAHYGLIHPYTGEDFQYALGKPKEDVSTLSIAQTISWAFQAPIENIWISEEAFKTESFLKKNPIKRITILFEAYRGCHWFGSFLRKQKAIYQRTNKLPTLYSWNPPIISELGDLFISNSTYGFIKHLIDKGFIVATSGEPFKQAGWRKRVDPVSLAELIAKVCQVRRGKVLINKNQDKYIETLALTFTYKKILPYMDRHRILYNTMYTLPEACSLTGLRYGVLYDAIRRESVPNTPFQENGKTKIQGIDLAIYVLKNGSRHKFTPSDLKELLGAPNIEEGRLPIKISRKGTYSPPHYVFPLYDKIAAIARNHLMNPKIFSKPLIPLLIGDSTKYLTMKAQADYCKEYGLSRFEQESLDHLIDQLRKSHPEGDNRWVSEDLKFRVEGDSITGISFRK